MPIGRKDISNAMYSWFAMAYYLFQAPDEAELHASPTGERSDGLTMES
jgi:hypothetical protein